MNRLPLTMVCTTDISGQVRGKGFPTRDLGRRLIGGVGWTPTNILITAFGGIAPGPFGALGDLVMMPDPKTEALVDFGDGGPREHFYLADLLEPDLSPWDCCPRAFLRSALAALEAEAGLRLVAAFEHEFVHWGAGGRDGDGYRLDALRRHGAFGEILLHALDAAGLEPESYLPEYGTDQFEVTCRPADGLTAADRAVILRELARATAHRLGHRVSFAPMTAPDRAGNGVHIHLSLRDRDDRPVTWDAAAPHGLSEPAARFIAGILAHLPAICAVAAPSVPSYLRLTPNRWSAAWTNLGVQDREAAIRICPLFATPGADPGAQFNFEMRAADATANAYLQLGILVRAGLEGLRRGLPRPEPTEGDPERLPEEERRRLGVARLPGSLPEALAALEGDAVARGWFPPRLLDLHLRAKRHEIALMADLDPVAVCRRYAEAY